MKNVSKRKIIWSSVAEGDLVAILAYLDSKSIDASDALFIEVERRTHSLLDFPNQGRVVPELLHQNISRYRELIINRYRLVYSVSDTHISILSFFDSRQNVGDILLKRLFH